MSAAIHTPLYPSLLTAVCALLIHPWAGKPLSQPISLELHDGNVFAFITLVGLVWVIIAVGARFWSGGLFLSAASCGLCVSLLVVIPMTDPRSTVHNLAFGALVTVAMGLFLVWAMDTFELAQALPVLLPIAFGFSFYVSLGVGGVQLLIIGSLLVALNFTFVHLQRRENFGGVP